MTRILTRQGIRFEVEDTDETSWWNFWSHWENGGWEPEPLAAMDRVLPDGGLLLDIGAWVGPFTLWAARRARVRALEPDPIAFGLLATNVAFNGFDDVVELYEVAAMPTDGPATFWSVSDGFGRSNSSTAHPAGAAIEVEGVNPIGLLAGVDLVKIDIEGGEVALLPAIGPAMRERGIPLLLSVHPFYVPATPEFTAELDRWRLEVVADHCYLCRP